MNKYTDEQLKEFFTKGAGVTSVRERVSKNYSEGHYDDDYDDDGGYAGYDIMNIAGDVLNEVLENAELKRAEKTYRRLAEKLYASAAKKAAKKHGVSVDDIYETAGDICWHAVAEGDGGLLDIVIGH